MENYIIIAILAVIAASILWYLWRAKRRGVKCIGCSCSGQCNGKCGGCEHTKTDKN